MMNSEWGKVSQPVHHLSFSTHRFRMAPLLLTPYGGRACTEVGEEGKMTRAQWWLLGAVLLGVVIVVYFVLFCPTECH